MRWFEVQLHRFLQIGQSLRFALALAGDAEFQALGDIPLPLPPNGRSEWSLHDLIVSQTGAIRTAGAGPNSIGYGVLLRSNETL